MARVGLSQFIQERVLGRKTKSEVALDFDPGTLPWIDRPDADVDRYLAGLGSTALGYDLREKLLQWKNFGYAVFEQAVSSELIDAYLADIAEFLARHQEFSTMITSETEGNARAKDLTRNQLDGFQMRICDLHNNAITGKKLGLNPTVVSFLTHVFHDQVVMMQSLTFLRSSEQDIHQDYAYVVAGIPSHLAASWIALENVHPDAGPLTYHPGSHRIPKFDFGNGLFLTPESRYREAEFNAHILMQCRKLRLKKVVFLPKKGDMFVWHSALAHGGSPVRNRALTRKSLVSHYSSRPGYPLERRNPNVAPVVYEYNAGLVYGNPLYPEEEDILKRGLDVSPS
jgi:ectoine hydroxylase-related dioxygenase (phytanoyl-CoA dioxygenase family)